MSKITVGQAEIWCSDCLDVAHQYPDNYFQLLLTSTPYPGLAGFDLSVNEYFAWWMARLLLWLPKLHYETGVIVQVVKFPRKEDGQFDLRVFDLGKLYESLGLYCIEVFPWDKINAPPSGNHERHDRDAYELCITFGKSKGYTYNKLHKDYAEKTVKKAASGNMRKADVRGNMAGGHSDLNPNGATLDNVLRISPTGGKEAKRPRVPGGSFPVELADRFVLEFSNIGDKVLDPFCGAGTVLARSLVHGRIPVGIDIDVEAVNKSALWCQYPDSWDPASEEEDKWRQKAIF